MSFPLSSLGLGYSLAIALAFLILLSSLLLASYLCFRSTHSPPNPPNPNPNLVIPRIIFVAEDDEENNGHDPNSPSPVSGLDPNAINLYPKFPFEKGTWDGDCVCSICLCEYHDGEMLRMMPDCRHCFHLLCLDAWLRLNASCPVCRNSPMPTPLSTPLSEVVPLSQYAADRRRR